VPRSERFKLAARPHPREARCLSVLASRDRMLGHSHDTDHGMIETLNIPKLTQLARDLPRSRRQPGPSSLFSGSNVYVERQDPLLLQASKSVFRVKERSSRILSEIPGRFRYVDQFLGHESPRVPMYHSI